MPDLVIREIGPGDEAAVTALLAGLDAESCYRRWFTGAVDLKRAADWAAHPERVNATGLLASTRGEVVGHAVLIPAGDGRGEIAFEVASRWRHQGVAGALLERLLEVAALRDLTAVYADVLPENADMLAVLREHGEHGEAHVDGVLQVTIPVPAQAPSMSPLSRA